jgi:hypothetical protein
MQTDVNHAIATQTEIGWLHMLCRSIDWLGHVNFDTALIPNPSKNIPTYLNQVRKAIKSRPSPDARRASANNALDYVGDHWQVMVIE